MTISATSASAVFLHKRNLSCINRSVRKLKTGYSDIEPCPQSRSGFLGGAIGTYIPPKTANCYMHESDNSMGVVLNVLGQLRARYSSQVPSGSSSMVGNA